MAEKTFRLYDSLSRTTKPVVMLEAGHLRFYTCGPTVYSYAHVGNFRSFLTADMIVRTARALGNKVTWVSNITDVGHLTDDDIADSQGEDKMEKALRSKEGEQFHNVWELAEFYDLAYRADWRSLNLTEPDIRPKATQHVREQIIAAEELIEKGFAYETPTGVYFSVEKFPGYGKLSGNTQDQLRTAVRDLVIDNNKRDQSDFAIWKKDDKHLMQWFSPYGWGFPGWHIECSVMARSYLGDTIDLHSGGEDNKFPHHECEIAQSEALTGKTFCDHWVHTAFLNVNGQKMSKSAGNFYTVKGLIDDGVQPLAIRLALLSGIYRKPLNLTDQALEDSATNIERFARARLAADEASNRDCEGTESMRELADLYSDALDAMCSDLNTPVAVAKALEGARLITKNSELVSKNGAQAAFEFMNQIESLLGIVPASNIACKGASISARTDTAWIEAKIADRKTAKDSKIWAEADALRADLLAAGVVLVDHADGTTTWAEGSA